MVTGTFLVDGVTVVSSGSINRTSSSTTRRRSSGGSTRRTSSTSSRSITSGTKSEVEAFLKALRQHESGNRNVSSKVSSASGYYQYTNGTWANYGGYRRAVDAPFAVQHARAKRDALRNFRRYGNWAQVAAHHFYPALAGSPNRWHLVPGQERGRKFPGNPTMQQFVNSIMSKMGRVRSGTASVPRPSGGGGGGRGGGGGGSGGVTDTGPAAPASQREINEFVQDNFGFMAWALDHPELGPLLHNAAREMWSEGRLQGALHKTRWWKRSSASMREWDRLSNEDPGEARRRVNQAVGQIGNRAQQLGVGISSKRLRAMARDSIRFGWGDVELRSALASEIRFSHAMRRMGQIRAFVDHIRAVGKRDFFLGVSNRNAARWAKRWVEGTMDLDTINSNFYRTAADRFPDFRKRILGGETPREVFDPYIALAGEFLEIDADSIDPVRDSRFSPMTEFIDTEGRRRAMTLSEWSRFVRRLPDYRSTNRAMEESAQAARFLVDAFGRGVL